MTTKDLIEQIFSLAKVSVSKNAVTFQERLIKSHLDGYNKCVTDVVILIERLKKEEIEKKKS